MSVLSTGSTSFHRALGRLGAVAYATVICLIPGAVVEPCQPTNPTLFVSYELLGNALCFRSLEVPAASVCEALSI